MRDKELIKQLKMLRDIHPDRNWVALTRASLVKEEPRERFSFAKLLDFNLVVPRPIAISIMGLIVVVTLTASVVNRDTGSDFASISRYEGDISSDTVQELKEIVDDVRGDTPSEKTTPITDYTVVFNENSDDKESFVSALRNRIESRISFYNDLLAQLDDGDLAREISLNPRKSELYSKLVDEDIAEQVRKFIEDAQEGLDDGNAGALIDALYLVNAADKLLK